MTPDQLMNVWKRLGASAPSHRKINQRIKGLVSNLAAAKTSLSIYANDPTQRSHAFKIYNDGVERTIQEIWDMQAKAGCKIPDHEVVARDADRSQQPDRARRLRRKAIIR